VGDKDVEELKNLSRACDDSAAAGLSLLLRLKRHGDRTIIDERKTFAEQAALPSINVLAVHDFQKGLGLAEPLIDPSITATGFLRRT